MLRPLVHRTLRLCVKYNRLHDKCGSPPGSEPHPKQKPAKKIFETNPICATSQQDGSTPANTQTLPENSKKDAVSIPPPPAPEECCMSGCANCIWITYAAEINRMYRDGGEMARQLILAQMEDPTMKAFITLEIRVNANAISSKATKEKCRETEEKKKKK